MAQAADGEANRVVLGYALTALVRNRLCAFAPDRTG
jgi:hypothetical protein